MGGHVTLIIAARQGFAVGVAGERMAHEFRSSNLSVSHVQYPCHIANKAFVGASARLSAEAAMKSGCCMPFRVVKAMLVPWIWVVMFVKIDSDDVEQLFVNRDQESRHRSSQPLMLPI